MSDPTLPPAPVGDELSFGYTNWRGEYAERKAIPLRIERKESEWHGPGLHWVMVAFDIEKQAERDFLLADMGRTQDPVRATAEACAEIASSFLIDWGNELAATRDSYIDAKTTGKHNGRRIPADMASEFARNFGHRAEAVAGAADGCAAAIRHRYGKEGM